MTIRFLVVLLWLGATEQTLACTPTFGPIKSTFHHSLAVFTGVVESFDPASGLVEIRVEQIFKGRVEVGATLKTDWAELGGASCGYPQYLRNGRRILVWTYDPRGEFISSKAVDFYVNPGGWTNTVEKSECVIGLLAKRSRWWRWPLSRIRVLRALGISTYSCDYTGGAG
jgi:hypothetical protein